MTPTANPSRMEMLGTLLTAMALVVMTGDKYVSLEDRLDNRVDVTAKPKLIVPLVDRFPGLLHESRYGRLRHPRIFDPRRFLLVNFNLNWARECDYLLKLNVMPSSIVRALAIEMADGDLELAQRIADSRSTKGIRAAEHKVNVAGCLITALWRFGGNPDDLWYALRDEMLRCRAEVAK